MSAYPLGKHAERSRKPRWYENGLLHWLACLLLCPLLFYAGVAIGDPNVTWALGTPLDWMHGPARLPDAMRWLWTSGTLRELAGIALIFVSVLAGAGVILGIVEKNAASHERTYGGGCD